MKKIIALTLTLALALSLAACAKPATPPADSTTPDSAVTEPVATPAAEASFKTGVGSVISATPTDATADKGSSVQINTTLVAATFDQDGKIVSASIDVAQQTAKFDTKGAVDGEVDFRTKNEKGPDYGMEKVSGIKKEIDAQQAALAEWMVGKTVAEVKATKLGDSADGKHKNIPQDEDLKTSVTVTIDSYIAALEKAEKNAVATTGVVAKTGLGTAISADVKAKTADKGASAQINTTYVVAAFDKDGKVVAATIDVAQQTAKFNAEGKLDGEIDLRTKNEKGPDYGMEKASPIKKEIDAQHASLAEWMIGKTATEIAAVKMGDSADGSHKNVPHDEDLKTTVTVTIDSYVAALVKAEKNAK